MSEKEDSPVSLSEKERSNVIWNQMVKDLHVMMSHPVDDPERTTWLEREKTNTISMLSGPQLGGAKERVLVLPEKYFLKMGLLDLKHFFSNEALTPRTYSLEITTGDPDPRCHWTKISNSLETHFDIFVGETGDPYAQEELLHAAQEILFRVDRISTFSIKKTTEQLVHTSFVLDMALSLAAVEEGAWEKWNQKSADLQLEQRRKYVQSYVWESTLLGKTLNRRFLYKNMSVDDVGLWWRNLSTYFEGMFNEVGSPKSDEMREVFELGCLTYGGKHRDLSYALIDLPIEDSMDNAEAGRVVVDWAKRLFTYLEDTEEESELLGHHSDVSVLPEGYFSYVLPEGILALKNVPLDAQIHTGILKMISASNWHEAVNEILEAYDNQTQSGNKRLFLAALKKHGISQSTFNQILDSAKTQFRQQYQLRSDSREKLVFFTKKDRLL